tara:strand:- start:1341 stop:2153 length:813 start_codon:yes stop_codon:yes gene_type:complete
MGKAMMGTGEAEGENRATTATDLALNNPLIDDYSLKGAKGLLVNITGGKDITLFEVDQAVNKIRAEVDPEAELIFGAIQDENLKGKMRVSIVATSLEGSALDIRDTEPKTVLNMVNRIQNRNTGYSDGLFPKSTHIENNTLSSIQGATALKLDDKPELKEAPTNLMPSSEPNVNETTSGVSIESASYIENNLPSTDTELPEIKDDTNNFENQEEFTPKLFSDEASNKLENESSENDDERTVNQEDNLFDQDTIDDEESFEIPAFLRKQKF